ncbi:hypothetical protein H072_1470 [Dactylellina haptotyla CBS 200.50]|uniref:Alpha/gamma-adaptin-binding protein p34 n=1 Tax=Dactylellina haptotyla (strain CBS 200.50) TaxID=1284197 RepID=S8CA52_DACHA|nr:hypothetical protein H072_1470 [Dactylellina haptotyla CBS 200.50]
MSERRILIVGRRDSEVLQFLETLTGSLPSHQHSESHAGLTHTLTLKTQYYTSTIPIWIDEITDPVEWSTAYASKEAKEVRQVLGAIIYVFKRPTSEAEFTDMVTEDLKGVGKVVKACGYSWDGVCLAVAMPHSMQPQVSKSAEEWDDVTMEYGFEFVDFEAKGRNDYGEPVGMERLREALEANDWNAPMSFGLDDLDDDELDELAGDDPIDKDGNVKNGLKLEANEMEQEMFGLHQAILGEGKDGEDDDDDDEEFQVEQLEAAMQRLQGVKDMISELPEDQKRAFAAKAVADVMKTL